MPRLLLLFLLCAPLSAQQIQLTDWQTLSSFRTARDADADSDGVLWIATSGGVFEHNTDTESTIEYRNIGALQTLDARAILCDSASSTVIVGGGDGALDIRNADGSWQNITDIKRASQYPRRGITDLLEHNGVIYISTEFGFVTFDLERRIFIETVDRIGTIQEKTRANGIAILRDSIWVATDSGLAVAELNEATLRPPNIWTILDTNQGLRPGIIEKIAATDSRLVVSTGFAALERTNNVFSPVLSAGETLRDISFVNERLVASIAGGIITTDGNPDLDWGGEVLGHSTVYKNGLPVIIGFVAGKAITVWNGETLSNVAPNSPLSNQFARLAIDSRGGLWVATDVEPPNSGQGAAHYDGNTWTSFTTQTVDGLISNACYRVSALMNGEVMVGTWGGGGFKASVVDGEVSTTVLVPANSALQGVKPGDDYCLVADAMSDRDGTAWMINEQAQTQVLVGLHPDGSSTAYGNCFSRTDNLYRAMAVDAAGNKWMGSAGGAGILAFNEKDASNNGDDICQVIRSSNSQLPDNVISVLRVDRLGQLWIGTAKGVAVIAGPTRVSNSTIPFVRRITALTSVIVNDIYVDALNYKWVATTGGVFVLNEDGTEVLATITTSTAPLLSDNIKTIAVNETTGLAYFGTSQGCNVAKSSSLKPSETFSLSFTPQPFRIQQDPEVLIDGLAADADIRIMTAGGFLVRALQARGRQALWDGKDTRGQYVTPGVYIVQTSSATSNESAVGKILVKR